MPFQKGQSGNPAGRPKGSRNRSVLLIEAMLEDEAKDLTRALIDKAKDGDTAALRICFDRLAPRLQPRECTQAFDLLPFNSAADMLPALEAIKEGLATGTLAAPELAELSELVDKWVEALKEKAEAARVAEAMAFARARYAHLGPSPLHGGAA
jgi:hypothetical protein